MTDAVRMRKVRSKIGRSSLNKSYTNVKAVSGDVLTIRGEKKSEKEEKNRNYYHRESWSGEFLRKVVLPEEVDSEKADAELKNGVLRLSLPKKENGR